MPCAPPEIFSESRPAVDGGPPLEFVRTKSMARCAARRRSSRVSSVLSAVPSTTGPSLLF
eukprot:6723491-Pyramimonas_sp.AAC.1